MIKHIDLFSGIGGFSYALDTIFYDQTIKHIFIENNEFCRAILQKHWPHAEIRGDIRAFTNTTNAGIEEVCGWSNEVFLVTGGFPCQPFSAAGRRRGTADDRYLWPEMFRVIQEFKPEWVVAENVRGLVTWNEGMVLEQVCADLESEGYEVQPLIIPAVAVNAPHRRDRVWIIANRPSDRREWGRATVQNEKGYATRSEQTGELAPGFERPDSNAAETRRERWEQGADESVRPSRQESERANCSQPSWNTPWLEVATSFCQLDDGISNWVDRCFRQIIDIKDYGQTIKKEQSENLLILQEKIRTGEIREKLGGQYSMEQTEILLSLLCRIQRESNGEDSVSGQSEKTEKGKLRELWNTNEARCSPRRWEYQEQLATKLKNLVPQLPHEIALEIAKSWDYLWVAYSAMTVLPARMGDTTISKPRHRKEQLKAYGNAIVPQGAMRIFQAIKNMINLSTPKT